MPGTKRFQHVIETPEPGKWELSGYEAALPITEKSNPLTQDLDKADAEQIVRLLGQCDAEIFQEEGQVMPTYQRLYSESVLTTMVQVAGKVQEVLKEPEGGLVVLSGGGNSGRMAFLMSVSFNQLMKGLGQKPLYTYLIAGGDWSVVASREGTEDSALHGIEELKKVAAGKKRVIVIGISVGLSAPFVAGQMDYCMDNPAIFLPVLVGFNPVNMARNDPIEDWSSTFRQIAERMQKLQEKQEAFVLNPAIGPEGLSGSSRMKGGSATKILLETLLLAAHKTVDRGIAASQRCLLEILRTFERAHKVTYSQSPKIAALMKQASTSLEKKGRVYLVGWQTLGIIAIMDGVECIHTFGADFRDVRGFLIGDHSDMFSQKAELINQGPQCSFSQEDFLTSILPSLTEIDTVVFIFTLDDNLMEVQTLVEQVKEKTANIQALAHSTVGQILPTPLKKLFPSIISIMWPLLFFEYEGNFIQVCMYRRKCYVMASYYLQCQASTGGLELIPVEVPARAKHQVGAEYREYRCPCASWEDPPKLHVGPPHPKLQAFLAGAGHAAAVLWTAQGSMHRDPPPGDPLPPATVGWYSGCSHLPPRPGCT
ncbi:glucokinase regulatory protein isoform X4 [Ursus arctos]|uniref:glucokinase regulatory protein isoform X4 n=1 Tax=Ursus arctos TaxID=9644 RepID=UPI001CF819B9|nr:glucokinase regulatory protein isoform X4 [Ursus arctos]